MMMTTYFSFKNWLLLLCVLLTVSGCKSANEKHGMVDFFHGRPRMPKMLPRTVLGDLPTGPFESHQINGILVLDTGADFDTNSAFTYLTYLRSRYVSKSGPGDVPFHFFIDATGKIFKGRHEITPGEIHEDDPFLYRRADLDRQELLMKRINRKTAPRLDIKG
jgi:hypothetical protein